MASVQRFGWWAPLGCVITAMACAEIVGLTGDYREKSRGESSGGSGDAAGSGGEGAETGGGSQGGAETGGNGGSRPTGGAAGKGGEGTGGKATGGNGNGGAGEAGGIGGAGGAAGAGTGGAGTGGDGGTGGNVVLPPSCAPGLATCGPDGTTNCCASHAVPGGEFDRGNDARYPATLSAFRLDDYEVTVARFRKFEAAFADGYRPAAGAGKNPNNPADGGWDAAWDALLPADGAALRSALACHPDFQTWTDEPGAHEQRPVNCVNWYLAQAFCIWDGGRLPTEAEWNYAAAGGDEQRVFPWSDPADDTTIAERHASYNVDGDRQCGGDEMDGCAITDLFRPGSRPQGDGRFGQADLGGNLYEWVQDRFDDYPTPCEDCANLTTGSDRTIRGGCFITYQALLRTTFRLNWDAQAITLESSGIGIRCARNP